MTIFFFNLYTINNNDSKFKKNFAFYIILFVKNKDFYRLSQSLTFINKALESFDLIVDDKLLMSSDKESKFDVL